MKLWITLISLTFLSISCTEQHKPEAHREAINAERIAANQPIQRLTADGKIQTGGAVAQSSGNAKYDSLCASCHGPVGGGDSPVAASLNPKPRNLRDAEWQASVTDEHIKLVIKGGGGAVGLSVTMPAWGTTLSRCRDRQNG